jgi:hypothetical protein
MPRLAPVTMATRPSSMPIPILHALAGRPLSAGNSQPAADGGAKY